MPGYGLSSSSKTGVHLPVVCHRAGDVGHRRSRRGAVLVHGSRQIVLGEEAVTLADVAPVAGARLRDLPAAVTPGIVVQCAERNERAEQERHAVQGDGGDRECPTLLAVLPDLLEGEEAADQRQQRDEERQSENERHDGRPIGPARRRCPQGVPPLGPAVRGRGFVLRCVGPPLRIRPGGAAPQGGWTCARHSLHVLVGAGCRQPRRSRGAPAPLLPDCAGPPLLPPGCPVPPPAPVPARRDICPVLPGRRARQAPR